jgi:CIC family chloride channel protein
MIIAAVSATLVAVVAHGNAPAFSVPPLLLGSLRDLPWVLLAAVVIGVVAAAFMHLVETFATLHRFPLWARITAAGALTGVAALVAPEVMGVGYDTVEDALLGEFGLTLLLLVAALKLVTSAAAAGLGVPAGIIGPTLVIGATTGGALGVLGGLLLPEYASEPGLYALLGMGAMMAAVLQAPLAALMAMLELTLNPNIILPAMLSVVVASLVSSQVFRRRSIFLTLLERRGLQYTSDPITLALQRAGVGSRMERRLVRARKRVTRSEAAALLAREPAWIVVDDAEGPVCVLAAADLARHLESGEDEALPAPAGTGAGGDAPPADGKVDLLAIPGLRKDVTLMPVQATLHEALAALDTTGKEAVCVTRTAAPMITPIIGVLTRADIEKYYGLKG